MKARRLIVTFTVGLVVVAACGNASPSPQADTASSDPTHGSSQTWRPQPVRAPDAVTFEAAVDSHDLIVGDLTTWLVADGRWLPAEPVEAADRTGIVAWHGSLISWADGGVIQISSDGLHWSDALSGPGESNPATAVGFENGLLLLGEDNHGSIGAWRSIDGSIWIANPNAPLGMKSAATLAGGSLVTVGWSGPSAAVWTTADSTTWTRQPPLVPDTGASALHGVAAGPANIVAIGDVDGSAAVWTSHDAVSWARAPVASTADTYLSSVSYVDSSFVIAGRQSGKPIVWKSVDGKNWLPFDLPMSMGESGEAVDITFAGDRVVAFGYTTVDAGNGGTFRTGYLVWSLEP